MPRPKDENSLNHDALDFITGKRLGPEPDRPMPKPKDESVEALAEKVRTARSESMHGEDGEPPARVVILALEEADDLLARLADMRKALEAATRPEMAFVEPHAAYRAERALRAATTDGGLIPADPGPDDGTTGWLNDPGHDAPRAAATEEPA